VIIHFDTLHIIFCTEKAGFTNKSKWILSTR